MDTGLLGRLAAQAMEAVENDFGEDGYVRTVAIVYEVDTGDATHINVTSSDDRPWVQTEFLSQGLDSIEARLESLYEDED